MEAIAKWQKAAKGSVFETFINLAKVQVSVRCR
jgi:hypothetical protein